MSCGIGIKRNGHVGAGQGAVEIGESGGTEGGDRRGEADDIGLLDQAEERVRDSGLLIFKTNSLVRSSRANMNSERN